MPSSPKRLKSEYVLSNHTNQESKSASPLALLAATCSKIGSAQEQQQGQGGKATQQPQIKVVSNTLSAALLQHLQQQNLQTETVTTVASQQGSMAPRDPLASSPSPPHHHQQPQVITLTQLQNLLPLQQVSAANNDIGHQLQGQTVKTFVTSAGGLTTPTVVSVQGVPSLIVYSF